MDNKFNIFISGFFAFGIYILVIVSFLFYLKEAKIEKYISASTDTILELDFIITESKNITNKNAVEQISKKETLKNDLVKKSTSLSANKVTNMKSLFANVKTSVEEVVEKKVNNVKNNTVSSRFKSKFTQEKSTKNIKINKIMDLGDSRKKNKLFISKSKDDYDKYYSSLHLLILERWYNYPLFTQDKYLVKVKIKIDLQGNMSYNILHFSTNVNVDSSIKSFLLDESSKKYPQNGDGMVKEVIINFKPEINNK